MQVCLEFLVKIHLLVGVSLGVSRRLSMSYFSKDIQWLSANLKGKRGIFSLSVLLGVFG
jgi:hypothetical protein